MLNHKNDTSFDNSWDWSRISRNFKNGQEPLTRIVEILYKPFSTSFYIIFQFFSEAGNDQRQVHELQMLATDLDESLKIEKQKNQNKVRVFWSLKGGEFPAYNLLNSKIANFLTSKRNENLVRMVYVWVVAAVTLLLSWQCSVFLPLCSVSRF